MKRSLALLCVLLSAALIPSTALAYLLPADLLAFIASVPSSHDFAVGEGKFSKGQPADQFNIAAHGSPTDAKGHVRFNSTGFAEARGEVDCLFVTGNKAAIAGTFDEPLDGQFPYFIVAVQDNGEPGGGVPDQAVLAPINAHPGTVDCGFAATIELTTPIVQGNIVVKDRP
jgi:hypothetical protein